MLASYVAGDNELRVTYHGAEKIPVAHESLKPKDPCPDCHRGKLYELPDPGIIVRVTGNAPCSGKVYELQKLRCNLCQKIFTAASPRQYRR